IGQIQSNAVKTASLDAGQITTGTLSAARIASRSITADKLNVNSLSAISANLGTVTAGHIQGVTMNLGNGQFIVDQNGNVSISNDKVTLSKDGIKVKDGDFMLEDNVSEMPYSIVAKANMVRDHSFELLLRDESTYDYQYHWYNIRMKYMYDNHW